MSTLKISESAEMYAGCIAGALKKEDYLSKIRNAGFKNITIVKEDAVHISDYIGSDRLISNIVNDMSEEEIKTVDRTVVSIKISANKK